MIDYTRFLVTGGNAGSLQPSPATSAPFAKNGLLPRPQKGEKFIAANVPWSWFAIAAGLPGKALAIGMLVWWLVTVNKQPVVAFSYKRAECTGLSHESIRQSIRKLELAGLISVQRAPGRSPRIRVLPAPMTVESVVVESDC